LQQALLHQEGGDRVMAQVLAEVPSKGLDAVLVAAELVLESAPPGAGQRRARAQRARPAERSPARSGGDGAASEPTPLADTAATTACALASDQEADHA
jgi:hypothetical protein